ncbi:hypothetical protein [Dyadobacter pollutisoli]|jgi:hypothetical protein|uniref:Uncharacterized protein n=1 Tax=Dyadobacter pollutisoli TaxID=2910158 RepID=A0A9E8NAC3_9BACT|nr:hypothetical protein [Dyadobacter pollutisoli]WAC10767.1 hypothetical protein ON006_23860 [Dyadobacter pollutisoli]
MHIHLFRNARRWDSCLLPIDDTTFGLILQFKVHLVRVEPTTRFFRPDTHATGNGILHDTYGTFHLDAWDNRDWEEYKRRFVEVVQRHWSDRFILDPNKDWYTPRSGSTRNSATIQCGLSIQLVETAAQAHQTYRIIHPREDGFRSYVEEANRSGLFTHQDLESHWNNRRTRVGTAIHSVDFLQTTINHEFGHTLGLDHVNGVGNSDSHYGVTLEQRENQMGMGGLLTGRHAQPWIRQMRFHAIPRTHYDTTVQFRGRVASPQLIEYWDNDWQPATTAS